MFVVRATKKLLSRVGPITLGADDASTTLLGDWYATALFWRPQVALFVNERTLLPALIPLAPASTLLTRFPDELGSILTTLSVPAVIVTAELAEMRRTRLAPTASRSVVGSMNEFALHAAIGRGGASRADLRGLSLELATMPCGPLFKRHVSPDRELAALVDEAG